MSNPNNNPDIVQPGPWIPEVFRSMAYCDMEGRLWVIDPVTWQWVLQGNGSGEQR